MGSERGAHGTAGGKILPMRCVAWVEVRPCALICLYSAGCCLLACERDEVAATRVDVTIDADAAARSAAARIVVRVFGTEGNEVAMFDRAFTENDFPASIRLTPGMGAPPRTFRIEGELIDPSGVAVSWIRARGGYIEGQATELRLRFDAACGDSECPPHEACELGACVGACFVPSELESLTFERSNCPSEVFVDGERGKDMPSTCIDPGTPCRTIQYALDQYVTGTDGAVVNVRGGVTYRPEAEHTALVSLRRRHSGTADRPTTIQAWPETGTPVLDGGGQVDRGIEFCCDEDINDNASASWVVVDGFEVVGAREHGITFNGSSAREVTVRNCVLSGNGEGPTRFDNRAGIALNNGAHDIEIIDSEIHDNQSANPDEAAAGMYINKATNVRVTGNIIRNNQGDGVFVALTENLRFERNRIVNNGEHGMSVSGTGILIEDTSFCANEIHGIRFSGGDAHSANHINSARNGASGIRIAAEVLGVAIRNSILAANQTFGVAAETAASNSTSEFNLYFDNQIAAQENIVADPTEIFDEDPRFIDIAACMDALRDDSPAKGASREGVDLGNRLAAPQSP